MKKEGLIKAAKGEYVGKAKLTEDQVRQIRLSKLPNVILADIYNMDNSTIRSIKNGRIWKHISLKPFESDME